MTYFVCLFLYLVRCDSLDAVWGQVTLPLITTPHTRNTVCLCLFVLVLDFFGVTMHQHSAVCEICGPWQSHCIATALGQDDLWDDVSCAPLELIELFDLHCHLVCSHLDAQTLFTMRQACLSVHTLHCMAQIVSHVTLSECGATAGTHTHADTHVDVHTHSHADFHALG
jgi:hypothetical protein